VRDIGDLQDNPNFPKAFRAQNDHPLMKDTNTYWVRCVFGYFAPGDGIEIDQIDGTITIDKKYNGALLTVNIDSPGEIALHASGGNILPDQEFIIGHGLSAVWAIENVHDSYVVYVKLDEGDTLNMCRISVQVNR